MPYNYKELHNHILAIAILGRIILLTIKFVFLSLVRQLLLVWLNKKITKGSVPFQQTLSFFGVGVRHILRLLFIRQTKSNIKKEK
jgi:uncharacterized membrane protein (DUF485 family)